ncbi:hypothetical protein P43SY_011878 [Pythium insidiosum]|uniref:non-specific serine/threonine protein kinase n=1 Tax=Pythium insidiosum TaxID=114742 RepID=A0AAD5LAJ2_PYTIN|nr:hypothetical protein P43SY_011878 [Pythium insidiosum]
MDTLARFLPALRSQSASMRLRAARELRHFIESESRDLSHGHYLKWVGEISAKLMELCNSADTLERMGGIAAMDELVELFIAERNDQTIIEFAHSLTKVFEKIPAADSATLRVASKALGHIVSTGGTSLIEFVEDYHVKPALEWLANDTYHVRRHAAVMILKELSVNAPSTSFRYIDRYFDIIWSAFWDARVVVRVSASESLQTCISLIQQREYSRRSLLYKKAYDEAMRSLQRGTSDAAHGALLIINELLRNTGDFMHHHYNDVCKVVFNLLEHKSPSVKSAVISIFPRLAKFNTSLFLETWFDPLLAQNDNLRCLFIALNDEIFEIRQTAMSMLGRLTHHNPAMVLPSLRQTLVQLLTELEFSGDTRDVPPALKKELCSSGARVAFMLQNWDAIPKYISSDMEETESHMFQTVVAIRRMELDDAMASIAQCRKVMDPTLRSLVSESYSRAYMPSIVNLQILTELEEVVAYLKTFASNNNGELTLLSTPSSRRKQSISSLNFVSTASSSKYEHEKKAALAKLQTVWTTRMLGVERNIQVWQNLMLVRSLVFDAREDVDIWLKYARLCRKSGHLNLAASALWRVGAQPFFRSIQKDPNAPLPINLGGPRGSFAMMGANGMVNFGDGSAPDPRVALSYLQHLWAESREDVALRQIHYFIEALERHSDELSDDLIKLRVQVYIQLGEWQMSLPEPRKQADGSFDKVIGYLETATKLDPTNHRAWHEWALMNFRAMEATPKEQSESPPATRYAAPAIQGFFKSIAFGYKRYDVTKDVLRLLTLWFNHGHLADVHASMITGFSDVSIDTWLDVIPQLIARIDSPNAKMNELLHELLSRIGLAHPQALIYPITVASKATNPSRKSAAEGILAAVRRHSAKLVSEADMVSRELIRVAILWNELWHGALEEASKHYFNNRDWRAMIAELAPLHEKLEQIGMEETPTLREVAFHQAFARDLRFAKEWTNLFEKTQNIDDLNQAWDIYYTVFSKIRKQLANLSTLELANVGPKLLSVQDLSLAVPGTYKSGAPIVRIMSFDSKVTVLTSKQRPRKVTINGSDGKAYPFLLKGHEDLRQDERVMQLFGVINTLLANDSDTSKRNLAIERYSVLPLSHTSGLIGWVPNCDTLHQLIRDYREKRKIQLNVEHRLMVQMAPDYDKLPLMQKVEAFKFALGETTGQDLYRVLWLKSRDSEVWLDRRRNYTRSLAVMSMAGYILGLGDRHPSNLMLDRVSGKMVHIDFGDCFEVAMERDKYPEKIPFRLTRMLTQAMEVSGIEGNFRYTCEASMRVLRDNRDSLMAVLEAFVYDPLINWRLLKKDTVPSHARPEEEDSVVNPTETRDGVGGRANSASGPQEPGSVVNSNADDDRSSVKSAPSAPPTPRRRRTSSNDGMFGFAIDPLDPTSLARNSIKEAQRDHDSKTIGQSVITAELPQLNEKALSVVDRVKKKLAGRDFDDGERVLSVDEQVDRLIMQATSHENLCQLYYGWCPFW